METPLNFDLSVVLVRSLYERNVGATARAMTNMGATRLILIAPQCSFTIEANQAAASGQKPFENKVIYKSWDEFFQNEPEGLRISLTARDGRGRAVEDLGTTLIKLKEESPYFQGPQTVPVYLFFGPEDVGLNAEDIKLSHYCCSIPTFGENSSLNLAQATLLALFITRQTWGGSRTRLDGDQKSKKRSTQTFPDHLLKSWLEAMGFDLSKRKMNAYTVLRRMLLHNTPTEKESRILEIVLQQNIRKLKMVNRADVGR